MRAARSAARSVQGEPAPAVFEPGTQDIVLVGARDRPRHVRHQELGAVEPAVEIGEVVRDGGRDVLPFADPLEQGPARVVHVMTGGGARRETADDEVRAWVHVRSSLETCYRRGGGRHGAGQSGHAGLASQPDARAGGSLRRASSNRIIACESSAYSAGGGGKPYFCPSLARIGSICGWEAVTGTRVRS